MVDNIVYLCNHCRSSHTSAEQVTLCGFESKDDLTPQEIYDYLLLRDKLNLPDLLRSDNKNEPFRAFVCVSDNYRDTIKL